jgi:hypothetical protein
MTQNKAKLCKILITALLFEKNGNFFAENCRESQKIVIITSTTGFESSSTETFERVATHDVNTNFQKMTAALERWGIKGKIRYD